MMGEEGKPGKKIKMKGRVKRPDRPPENPVVDVSEDSQFEYFYTDLQRKKLQPQIITTRHSDQNRIITEWKVVWGSEDGGTLL